MISRASRRGRRAVGGGLMLVGALAPGERALAQAAGEWSPLLNANATYHTWRTKPSGPNSAGVNTISGAQVYVPLAAQVVGRPSDELKLEALWRSAYVSTRQSTGGTTGEFSGLSDSTFSTTATYFGIRGIQPFVSLSVNVPTGTSNAKGSQSKSKSDADIVQIPAYGEGWNFGPTVGANIPINASLIATVSLGYTNRGEFDRESSDEGGGGSTRFDPGDVLTVTTALGYRGERLSLKGTVAYSTETTTTLGGEDFYKSGNRYSLTGAAGYAWTDKWSSRVQLIYSHFDKNRVRENLPPLVEEAFNSNSDVYKVAFDTTYNAGIWGVGPTLGYTLRDRNSWDPTTFQFLPAKTSWSVGFGGRYDLSEKARLTAKVEHIWTQENATGDKFVNMTPIPGSPEMHTDAWQFSLGGSIKF